MKDYHAMKVDYYLEHEEERQYIASNGYERVKREHDLPEVVEEMLVYTMNMAENNTEGIVS